MITVDDDQVRSCGGDSGGIPVPTSDDAAAGRQMLTTMGEHHQQQLTVSRIRTAVSMLTRRTGHARFRRGPVAERHHASSSDHHQLRPPAAGGGVALDLDLLVAKTCDDAAAGFSASASWTSSSLPSTTSLTAGEGSVSKGHAQQQGCGALFFVQPVSGGGGGGGHSAGKPLRLAPSSMQQQHHHHASPGYSSPGNALELEDGKCHDHARSENDAAAAGGKTHGDRCHCSKKRYVQHILLLIKRPLPPMMDSIIGMQEIAREAGGGPRAGDQLPERGHPAGRLLVAQVRPEAHQGLAVPAVSDRSMNIIYVHILVLPRDYSWSMIFVSDACVRAAATISAARCAGARRGSTWSETPASRRCSSSPTRATTATRTGRPAASRRRTRTARRRPVELNLRARQLAS
jgi:hypothetical protein